MWFSGENFLYIHIQLSICSISFFGGLTSVYSVDTVGI